MINKIKIFDLDGTLINSLHRYRLLDNGKIDLPYWIENCTEEKINQDTLLPLADYYKRCLENPNYYVIIATCRLATIHDINYVRDNLGLPDKFIYNRGECSTMRGADFKGKKLQFINNLKQFKNSVKYFYEDNLDYLHGVKKYIPDLKLRHIPSKQGA